MSDRLSKLAYKIPEALEVSSLGRTKLYELIREGEIEVVRVGRRVLVPHSSLAAYFERVVKNDRSGDGA